MRNGAILEESPPAPQAGAAGAGNGTPSLPGAACGATSPDRAREHVLGSDCWCNPVVVHVDGDGRRPAGEFPTMPEARTMTIDEALA